MSPSWHRCLRRGSLLLWVSDPAFAILKGRRSLSPRLASVVSLPWVLLNSDPNPERVVSDPTHGHCQNHRPVTCEDRGPHHFFQEGSASIFARSETAGRVASLCRRDSCDRGTSLTRPFRASETRSIKFSVANHPYSHLGLISSPSPPPAPSGRACLPT